MKILDVVGKTYNGITILEKLPSGTKPSGQKFSIILCKCKCGKVKNPFVSIRLEEDIS